MNINAQRACSILKRQYSLARKRRGPLSNLIFEVTFRCNAKCVMCFNWKQRDSQTLKDLTLDEIDSFTNTMGKIPDVTLGGGEPNLRTDLPEICDIFTKNNGTNFFVMPTNGLLPDVIKKNAMTILEDKSRRLMVNLSIDGKESVHDKIRGVKGCFKKVMKTYGMLCELKKIYGNRLIIGANTILCNYNEDHVSDFADFVRQEMPMIVNHTFESIRGSFNNNIVQPPSPEKYSKIMKSVYPIPPNNSILHSYYHKVALDVMREKRQTINCLAGYINPVIDSYGNVYLCEVLPAVGNLRDSNYDFESVWNSVKANETRKMISAHKCSCTHFCFQYFSILYSPKVLAKALLRWYWCKLFG
jgi:MoaA/NifB/PqqE/SkfB family radical SAM enzyme